MSERSGFYIKFRYRYIGTAAPGMWICGFVPVQRYVLCTYQFELDLHSIQFNFVEATSLTLPHASTTVAHEVTRTGYDRREHNEDKAGDAQTLRVLCDSKLKLNKEGCTSRKGWTPQDSAALLSTSGCSRCISDAKVEEEDPASSSTPC